MQPVDYATLLETGALERILSSRATAAHNFYPGNDGAHYRSRNGGGGLVQDLVRLSDGAFLFASNNSTEGKCLVHHQLVQESDWIHIQFRINGGGREHISETEFIDTPEKTCIVARYPRNALIERRVDVAGSWRVVCLFLSPAGISQLMDVPVSSLPESASWIATPEDAGLRSAILPLNPSVLLAINDILSCTIKGAVRRAYMRGKSLELLTSVIQTLDSTAHPDTRIRIKLSAADCTKLAAARQIMNNCMENPLTLAELARRVGLNRTKLAIGFKQLFGVSVQAYWRDARLTHARELLCNGETLVTDVAFSLGYSEISSFSRAFSRKFGVLPRDCKNAS